MGLITASDLSIWLLLFLNNNVRACLSRVSFISNMYFTPMYREKMVVINRNGSENTRNNTVLVPLTPTTNPTKFAVIRVKMFRAPASAQHSRNSHEDLKDCKYPTRRQQRSSRKGMNMRQYT